MDFVKCFFFASLEIIMWFLFFSPLIWWSTLILKWWTRLASWDKIHVDVIFLVHIVGFHLLIFCWEFWHLLSWRILFFVVLSLSHFKIEVMLIFYVSWEVFSPLFSVSHQPHACTGWGFMESFMGFFPQAPSRHDFLHSLQLPVSHCPSSWVQNIGFYLSPSVSHFPWLVPLPERSSKRKETMAGLPLLYQVK